MSKGGKRTNAGRKPFIPGKLKDKRFTLRMYQEDYNSIQETIQKKNMTFSDYVVFLHKQYLDKNVDIKPEIKPKVNVYRFSTDDRFLSPDSISKIIKEKKHKINKWIILDINYDKISYHDTTIFWNDYEKIYERSFNVYVNAICPICGEKVDILFSKIYVDKVTSCGCKEE